MLRRIPFVRVRAVALRSWSIRTTTTNSSVGVLNNHIVPQEEPLHESDTISGAKEHVDNNNLWTKAAQRLLESEELWSSSRRHEAARTIHHADSVQLAMALFDRLVTEEQEHNDKREYHDVDTERELEDMDMLSDLFSLIIVNWKNDDNRRTIEPRELLEKLETYRKKGAIQSSIQMYSMILDVASMQGLSSAPDLADYILTLIKEQNMYADPAFYSTAITAYARSDRPDAQERAQELLNFSLACGDASVETYTATITTWANSGHRYAPQRAEALLEQMSRTHNAQPDTMAFAAVLNAWAKSDNPNACYRALAILRHLTKLPGIKANAVVYNTVMSAFARQGMAMEAEKLLSKLTQKYEATQDEEYFPSVVLFSVVIDAWSKNQQPDAAIRAEAFLDMMLRLSQDTPELLPNKVSFNGVIHAWALSSQPEAPKRAAAILNKMQDLYQKTGNPDIKPTSISLSAVINAWAKSKHYADAGPRAEAVLNHMSHAF
jgi:pentatricopeptide repeat protein